MVSTFFRIAETDVRDHTWEPIATLVNRLATSIISLCTRLGGLGRAIEPVSRKGKPLFSLVNPSSSRWLAAESVIDITRYTH